jgi:DNA-binding MarR family transcriptional regulator
LLDETVRNLRAMILAGENYRQTIAEVTGLGVTETQALSYLAIHGDQGQGDLAAGLGLTSSASTALLDRLERQAIAERYAHPRDRRRFLVRLTPRGREVLDLSHQWLSGSLVRVPPDELAAVCHNLAVMAEDLRNYSARVRSGEIAVHATGAEPAADDRVES